VNMVVLGMRITNKRRARLQAAASQFLLGIAGLALITFVCFQLDFGVGRTAFAYLILVVSLSVLGSVSASVVLSIIATACLNFFFAPPLFELRVDAADDGVRIAMFLTASLIATLLTTRRKRAEQELGETNAKLEDAQQIAHVGWWDRDLITGRVTVSDEVVRILGMRPVAPWLELIHPEDRARVADAAAAAVRPGGPRYDVEYRVLRPDGALRVIHSQGKVTWDDSGRPLRKFGVLQDITERRQAERELRASEVRFRTLVDHASDAFFLYNEDATVLDVNRQACENLGYRRDELIGMTAFDYGPDLTPALLQRIRERLRGGKIVAYDGRHRRKDGSVFPVEIRMRQLWHEGKMLAVSLDRDITERKRAEDELRASEERFRTFVDHATDAFLLLDDDWTVLDVNRQACDSLGYSSEELIGKHKRDFDVGLDDMSIQRLKQRMVAGEAITFETRHRRKDGTSFPVEVRVGRFEQGGRRYLCLVRDVSERKRAEDDLRASEERFRTLVEFSFDVYWESDAQHRFIRQEFAEGLTDAPAPGSEIGKTRWEVPYLEPDEEGWRKHRETLDAHLPFRDFELARPAPDGGKRYVSVSGLPVFDGAGHFIGYRGVGRHITERKQAESELRDSQKKLEAAQRIAHVGWWERDFITNRVSLSDEVCRTFGVRPVDLPEWHGRWLDLIHPDDRARAAEAAAEALNGGRRYDLEYRVVRPGGNIRIVHSQGDVTCDESGRPLRQFGVLQDITELRQTEDELRASEARFRTFVDHATDAFFLHDEQAIVVDVNRQACEGLGYSREELIGMHPRAFDVGLDAPAIDRVVEQVRSGQTVSYETLHRRKNGEVFPVEIRLRRLQQGNALFGLGLARDITDRKRAEQRLVAQHRVAQLVANAASIEEAMPRVLQALCECLNWDMSALWRVDHGAGVLRCEQLWHKPSLEATQFEAATWASTFERDIGLPGKVWASRAAACIADVANDPGFLRATVAAREGIHAAFAFPILLDGEVIGVIDLVNREVRVPDEELIHAMATIGSQIGQFIERKRAENALLVAQAEIAHISRLTTMGELTASIAHEINQPLTGVVSSGNACLRYLANNVSDIEAARRAVERIIRDAMRANEVIKRIRALATKSPTKKVRLDINEVVIETTSLVRPELRGQNISLHTELAKGLSPVTGDQIELQQVLLNLIMNAKEAMSAVDDHLREISIRTEQIAPNEVLVSVRDTGPGVDEAELDRMFEAFHTTKPTGMGMGLAISRSIIEAHGGRLWANPNQPRGAVFQFTVSVWQEEEQ
jgi:PAS domain S-box-containing protein